MAIHWLTSELADVNPDWFGEIKLLSVKKGEKLIINETLKNFAADWK